MKIVYKELSSLASDLGFSPRFLYTISNEISKHYKTVIIPKKNGKKRFLRVPDESLKMIQRSISNKILVYEPVSIYAKAYSYGCSTVNNAKYHVGNEFILKLDINHFFDHITFSMVKEKVFPGDKYSDANRNLLTILCIDEHTIPQGAPTSPLISNIILRDFDVVIGKWCDERNITYTRYCDDMTFSGTFEKAVVAMKVKEELGKLGFFLNGKKTKYIHNGQCKNVTGIVVNEKMSAPKQYKKQIRKEMYYCMKYGIGSHLKHTNQSKNISQYINELLGKINYVLSIEDNKEMKQYRKWMLNERNKK